MSTTLESAFADLLKNEFKTLLALLPLGGRQRDERNRKLLCDWYLRSIEDVDHRADITLGKKYGMEARNVTRLIRSFEAKAREYRFGNNNSSIISTLTEIGEIVKAHRNFVVHDLLAHELVEANLTSEPIHFKCIQNIDRLFSGIPRLPPVQRITANRIRYIAPEDLDQSSLKRVPKEARKLALTCGGMYPYESFLDGDICRKLPETQREHIVHVILKSQNDYLHLGNEQFFAFRSSGRRLFTILKKIFSTYREVPASNLKGALYRPTVGRFQSKGFEKVKLERYLDALKQCAEVYDEYCLKMEFCVAVDGGNRLASAYLMEQIRLRPPSSKTLEIEQKLYQQIYTYGRPMPTKEFFALDFFALLRKRRKHSQLSISHLLDFSVLYYREKIENKKSIYCTLDNRYTDLNSQTDHPVQQETGKELSSLGAGFGDSEKNREVEVAAITRVVSLYKNQGWLVESVETEKRGYDLLCKKELQEEHVEVKGIQGEMLSFPITANEYQQARTDARFVICIVTNALSVNPLISTYSGADFINKFCYRTSIASDDKV